MLLEQAITRSQSPRTIQAALPGLRATAAVTSAPKDLRVLAAALRAVDAGEAEKLMRAAIAACLKAGTSGPPPS
jgi:hypothetical protein